jgi:CheY-like chemotaxis protein
LPVVLIVDDDESIRQITRDVLEDAGYIVLDTPNGGSALDILHTSQERLIVLLDMRMPDDGQAVMDDIAQDASLAERHRFILFTATSVSPPPVAVNLQIPVLNKPFDIDELLRAVSEAADELGD